MIKNLKTMALGALGITMVLAYSCTKPKPAPVNNTNSGNTNADAPSLAVYQPAVDTTVGISATLTVKIIATASTAANVDSILGADGLGHKVRILANNIKNGSNISYTKDTLVYDYYQLPTSATGTTVDLTYTVYGKGKSNTITRKIKVISVPVFKLWSVTLGDQNQSGNGAFLNTGGNPKPGYYATGDVNSDTALRRLVDMCCAHTAGQTDMLFSPGYVNDAYSKSFADSNIFNINNGWLLSQRRITFFRKLAPKYVVSGTNTNFQTYAEVEAAYKGATTPAMPKVQYPFSPNDNYAFLTWDGRYGVFTVTNMGGGVAMVMALESR
jgi:hypothetical protein